MIPSSPSEPTPRAKHRRAESPPPVRAPRDPSHPPRRPHVAVNICQILVARSPTNAELRLAMDRRGEVRTLARIFGYKWIGPRHDFIYSGRICADKERTYNFLGPGDTASDDPMFLRDLRHRRPNKSRQPSPLSPTYSAARPVRRSEDDARRPASSVRRRPHFSPRRSHGRTSVYIPSIFDGWPFPACFSKSRDIADPESPAGRPNRFGPYRDV